MQEGTASSTIDPLDVEIEEERRRALLALKYARKSFVGSKQDTPNFSLNPLLLPDWLADDSVTWKKKCLDLVASRSFRFFVLWIAWLITGTTYYATALDLGPAKGLYMAVNVGYSIGWGDIATPELGLQWFSSFYVLIGASFVGAALGFFAEGVVADSNNWYNHCKQSSAYEEALEATHNPILKVWKWCRFHWNEVRAIMLWFIIVACATIGSCRSQSWPFVTGLYFAISSISTGGLQALEPAKTEEWMYGMTGLYACIGVPLMGVAMATIAAFIMPKQSIEDTMHTIRSDVTEEEVDMLVGMGMADGDGVIDKTEFIILCMIRIGAADPMLIHLITEYFELLDEDNSGGLTLSEITATAKEVKQRIDHESAANKLKAAAQTVLSSSPSEKEIVFGAPAGSHQATRRRSTKFKRKSLHNMYKDGDVKNEYSAAERLNMAKLAKEAEVIAMFKKQLKAVTIEQQDALVMDNAVSEDEDDNVAPGGYVSPEEPSTEEGAENKV
jgi:hypothetical protein